MKTLLTAILISSTSLAYSQTSCDNIRFMGQMLILNNDLPLHKLKKYENTNFIADSVRKKIALETITGSSNSFFQQLQVKNVYVLDSTARKRIMRYSPVYDKNGDEVDFLYVFLYEIKLNGNISFIFRVDYKRNGELLKGEELKSINSGGLKIIPCNKAISTALSDKIEPISKVEIISLYYNPTYKSVVYQVSAPLDSKTQTQKVKFINAYNGKVVAREKLELHDNLKETIIGG